MIDNIELTFGEKIKVIRNARGLTQSQLAKMVGIAQLQISLYETGRVSPNLNTLEWICKALKVKASDLLGF